jgi:hypothetical protein
MSNHHHDRHVKHLKARQPALCLQPVRPSYLFSTSFFVAFANAGLSEIGDFMELETGSTRVQLGSLPLVNPPYQLKHQQIRHC